MRGSMGAVIGEVVHAAGSVVGYRGGTEEPDYSAERLIGSVEIRRYGPRIRIDDVAPQRVPGHR